MSLCLSETTTRFQSSKVIIHRDNLKAVQNSQELGK
jgi:hypothetical protein